jgi:hypothetical protein
MPVRIRVQVQFLTLGQNPVDLIREAVTNSAEQFGQPEWRLARFVDSKPVAAARLPLSFGDQRT